MLLNQDQEMIRDALRDFVREQITPHAARWDKEHHFPKDVHQGLAALGAYGICVPEELGGAGLDYISLALVLEEIAAGDGGTSTVISTRTVCSFKSFSTSAPRYAPGSAPSMAHSAGFHSTLPLFMYFSVAESEPQQADILFVPAASVGESPTR